jgi:hypothetical protein
MNTAEFDVIHRALMDLWPNSRDLNPRNLAIWKRSLKGEYADSVVDALEGYRSESKFFPTIREIKQRMHPGTDREATNAQQDTRPWPDQLRGSMARQEHAGLTDRQVVLEFHRKNREVISRGDQGSTSREWQLENWKVRLLENLDPGEWDKVRIGVLMGGGELNMTFNPKGPPARTYDDLKRQMVEYPIG